MRIWNNLKKAAIGALFAVILLIPKIRGLRCDVLKWSAVRLMTAGLGCALTWRYKYADGGLVSLIPGIALMAFGLLCHAKPEAKPVDVQAHDLGALAVLNGGAFMPEGSECPSLLVSIFVCPGRLFVVDEQAHAVEIIPLVQVRKLATSPVTSGSEIEAEARSWDLEITWESKDMRTDHFRYNGFFAGHLARVAEATVRNALQPKSPVPES